MAIRFKLKEEAVVLHAVEKNKKNASRERENERTRERENERTRERERTREVATKRVRYSSRAITSNASS